MKPKPPLPPVVPQDAPAWFLAYGADVRAAISALVSEVEALKARLAQAGIV